MFDKRFIFFMLKCIDFLSCLRVYEKFPHVAYSPISFQISGLLILTLKLRDALNFELLETFHRRSMQHVLNFRRT